MSQCVAAFLPRSGFIGRISLYLGEMFPVPRHLLGSALLAISFQLLLARLNGVEFVVVSPLAACAAANVFLLFLLLRLMDELKDRDIDRELFCGRPLPSGRVQEADIRLSLVLVSVGYLTINSWSRTTLAAAAGVFVYALLMYRFFFIPGVLRRYLLLNLATHNPITPLMFLQQTALMAASRGRAWSQLDWPATLLLIGAFWGPLLAWEIARKIRAPQEENEYVTYSQLLGRWGSVLAALGLQTFSLVALVHFLDRHEHSWVAVAVLAVGYAMLIWAYGRFVARPSPTSSRLRGFAERYVMLVCSSVIIEWLISREPWGWL